MKKIVVVTFEYTDVDHEEFDTMKEALHYIEELEETRFAYIVEVDGDNLQVNARPPEGQ